ncbi:MAG: efflux RND transporter periplasmic adaptor subunit [Planctomycetales bacterium]|nr:efflux RND transporter periplasmic adaptor subunit [Planctomycetales bacterium]
MSKHSIHPRLAKFLPVLKTWSIVIVGSLGVGLILLYLAGVFSPKVPSNEDHAPRHRALPADAQFAQAELLRRPRFESAVGSIAPVHQSSIAAKILARVLEVNVTAGQPVLAGDVLVRLNDDDLRSRLQQAEAQHEAAGARLNQARSDYQRASGLIQGNAISRAEYESLATAVRTSEAELERSARAIDETKIFLDYATITAPFDGIVVDKQAQAGDMVTPGQTLLTIYDPNQMQLVANVRESLAMKLKVGQEVTAKLESLDHECLATVREVVPQADVGSRSFQVKVSGPCPPGVYSGMFGRILLPLEDEQIIIIPAAAVRRVGQLTLVDVRSDNGLIRRNVQIGRRLGDDIEILSGLRPGEQVLLPVVPASTSPAGFNSTGGNLEGTH